DYLIADRDIVSEHCIETHIYYDREYVKKERSIDESLSLPQLRNAVGSHHPGVHCHVFDGRTFLNKILKPLMFMKIIPWTLVDYLAETPAGEFYLLLRKGPSQSGLTTGEFFGQLST